MNREIDQIPTAGDASIAGEAYPVAKWGTPTESATLPELAEAGFEDARELMNTEDVHASIVVHAGGRVLGDRILTDAKVRAFLNAAVLRVLKVDGRPVAVWGDGRWWTPAESAERQRLVPPDHAV